MTLTCTNQRMEPLRRCAQSINNDLLSLHANQSSAIHHRTSTPASTRATASNRTGFARVWFASACAADWHGATWLIHLKLSPHWAAPCTGVLTHGTSQAGAVRYWVELASGCLWTMATDKGQGNGVDPDMMKALEKLAGLVGDEEVDPSLRESLKHVAAGLGTDSARRAQRGSHSSSGSDSGSSRSRGRRGRSRTRRRRGSGSTGSRGSLSSGSRSRSRSSGSRSRSRSSGSLSGSRSRSRSTGSRSSYSRSPSEGSRSRSRSSSASSRSSSYSDEWRGPRGSPGRSTGSRPGAAVAVRRPTPYELWASAHMVVKKKVRVGARGPSMAVRVLSVSMMCCGQNNLTSKKLTNKEWQGIVQRLNDTTRQRHARLLQEQNQVIADEVGPACHCCSSATEQTSRLCHARAHAHR